MAEVVGRDDVDVAWIMKSNENEVTLVRDKGRGFALPEKVMLCHHAAPKRHLPLVVRGQEAGCVEALDRLYVSLIPRDEAAKSVLRDSGYGSRTADGSCAKGSPLVPVSGTEAAWDG